MDGHMMRPSTAVAAASAAVPADTLYSDAAVAGRPTRTAFAAAAAATARSGTHAEGDCCCTRRVATAAAETLRGAAAAASAVGGVPLMASWSRRCTVRRGDACIVPQHSSCSNLAAARAAVISPHLRGSALATAVLQFRSSCSSAAAAARVVQSSSGRRAQPDETEPVSAVLQDDGSSCAPHPPAAAITPSWQSRHSLALSGSTAKTAVPLLCRRPHARSHPHIACDAAAHAAAVGVTAAPPLPTLNTDPAASYAAATHPAAAALPAAAAAALPAAAAGALSWDPCAGSAVCPGAPSLQAAARLRFAAAAACPAARQVRLLSSASTWGVSLHAAVRPAAAAGPLHFVSSPFSALRPSLRWRGGTAAARLAVAAAAAGNAAAAELTAKLARPTAAARAAVEGAAEVAAESAAGGRKKVGEAAYTQAQNWGLRPSRRETAAAAVVPAAEVARGRQVCCLLGSNALCCGARGVAAAAARGGRGFRLFASTSSRRLAAAAAVGGGGGQTAAAAAVAAAPGGWGTRSTLLSLFCRGICIVTGFGLAYSFTNPDEDTVYEVFPLEQQHRYALLTFYRVHAAAAADFEERIKSLSRFYQQQQGYLFTRLLRADSLTSSSSSSMNDTDSSKKEAGGSSRSGSSSSIGSSDSTQKDPYRYYMQITTWLTADDYVLASGKPVAQRLTAELPAPALLPTPVLYENVADDTKYMPTAAGGAAAAASPPPSPHPVAASMHARASAGQLLPQHHAGSSSSSK